MNGANFSIFYSAETLHWPLNLSEQLICGVCVATRRDQPEEQLFSVGRAHCLLLAISRKFEQVCSYPEFCDAELLTY